MARPKKYIIEEMIPIIEEYTDKEDIPILKEVCYLNKWNSTYIHELAGKEKELSDAIKRLIDKKEVQLEKLALFNVINNTMAIFSLKQLGWSDKKELQHTTKDNKGNSIGILNRLSEAYDEAGKDSNI